MWRSRGAFIKCGYILPVISRNSSFKIEPCEIIPRMSYRSFHVDETGLVNVDEVPLSQDILRRWSGRWSIRSGMNGTHKIGWKATLRSSASSILGTLENLKWYVIGRLIEFELQSSEARIWSWSTNPGSIQTAAVVILRARRVKLFVRVCEVVCRTLNRICLCLSVFVFVNNAVRFTYTYEVRSSLSLFIGRLAWWVSLFG